MEMMDWARIRNHYAALVLEARTHGMTQAAIAKAGGLAGQNAISKLLTNHNQGPSVETFVKAIQGLGKSASVFFAEIERGVSIDVRWEQTILERLQKLEATVAAASLPTPGTSGRVHEENRPLSPAANVVHIIERFDLAAFETIIKAYFDRLGDDLQRLVDRVAPGGDANGKLRAAAPAARPRRRRRVRKTA